MINEVKSIDYYNAEICLIEAVLELYNTENELLRFSRNEAIKEVVQRFEKYQKLTIFLSHRSTELVKMLEIKERLEYEGVNVIIDRNNLGPNDRITNEIKRLIKKSDFVFLLSSNQSLTSQWVGEEIQYTLYTVEGEINLDRENDKKSTKKILIPILIDSINWKQIEDNISKSLEKSTDEDSTKRFENLKTNLPELKKRFSEYHNANFSTQNLINEYLYPMLDRLSEDLIS